MLTNFFDLQYLLQAVFVRFQCLRELYVVSTLCGQHSTHEVSMSSANDPLLRQMSNIKLICKVCTWHAHCLMQFVDYVQLCGSKSHV